MRKLTLFKTSAYSALVFFGTLILLTASYATWNAVMSSTSSWATLSSSNWNAVVDNVNDINSRMQTVVLNQSTPTWTTFSTDPTNGSVIQTLTIPTTGKYLVRSQTNFWITNTVGRNYLIMTLFLNGSTTLTYWETEAIMNGANYPYDGSFVIPSVVRNFNAWDVLTLTLRNPETTSNNLVHYYKSAEILAEMK